MQTIRGSSSQQISDWKKQLLANSRDLWEAKQFAITEPLTSPTCARKIGPACAGE
jgi:hypothetical protein